MIYDQLIGPCPVILKPFGSFIRLLVVIILSYNNLLIENDCKKGKNKETETITNTLDHVRFVFFILDF